MCETFNITIELNIQPHCGTEQKMRDKIGSFPRTCMQVIAPFIASENSGSFRKERSKAAA